MRDTNDLELLRGVDFLFCVRLNFFLFGMNRNMPNFDVDVIWSLSAAL